MTMRHILLLLLMSVAQAHTAGAQRSRSDCVIHTSKGHRLSIDRFTHIANGIATYERNGSLHDVHLTDIRKLTCNNQAYEIAGDTLRPIVRERQERKRANTWTGRPVAEHATGNAEVNRGVATEDAVGDTPAGSREAGMDAGVSATLSHQECAELGIQDARTYYKGGGAVLLGMYTAPTLILPPILGAIPPVALDRSNPNLPLYMNDPAYMEAYREEARKLKMTTTMSGMGLMLFILISALAFT
jgi:hypothetical protein